MPREVVSELAPTGVLRAAINMGNALLVTGRTPSGDPEGVAAGIIEFVGGILIALGLFTSPAALIASGEMAVAYFKAHAPRGLWPIMNRGELATLYCFFFLYVAARGAGPWSLDALRRRQP